MAEQRKRSDCIGKISNEVKIAVLKDFLTSFVDSNGGISLDTLGEKYNLSPALVKNILLEWIKKNENIAFENVLKSLIDRERDYYWFWKHSEDRKNEELSRNWIAQSLHQKIALSEYKKESVYKFFSNIINKQTEHICLLGGNIEDNYFTPCFVHDISNNETLSVYGFSPEETKYKTFDTENIPEIVKELGEEAEKFYLKNRENEKKEGFCTYRASLNSYDIMKRLTLNNCNALILAHNHPSGDVLPSKEDIFSTIRLLKGFGTFGITLIDHLIVGSKNDCKYMYSMRLQEDIFKQQYNCSVKFQKLDSYSSEKDFREVLNEVKDIKGKFYRSFLY